MRKMAGAFIGGLLLLTAGCAHLPGRIMSVEETQALTAGLQGRLPAKYEALNMVVFKYGFFSLPSLGMTSVDTARDYLAVAGVTPVGITLFRVVSEGGKITQSFVVPELAKRGDVAKVVADSIRDIYFELIPREAVTRRDHDGKIYLKTFARDGMQKEYVFSSEDQDLAEKRLYKKGRLFWRIFYSAWSADAEGKTHPGVVRFVHQAYRYQIVINLKEVRPL